MNLLQYTSDEMYSSTELIRKSKNIFDKLSKKDIEKAIILRDGKPSFLLLDFKMYEEIMKEYMELKENAQNKKPQKVVVEKVIDKEIIEPKIIETKEETIEEKTEIEADDLKNALDQIENLNFDSLEKPKKEDEKTDPQLKDFWE